MMTALAHAENVDFLTLLSAPGRSPEIPESADAYGWLVGSWDLDVLRYWATDVSARTLRAKPTSDGCSKVVPCRMSGSCHNVQIGVPIWRKT